MKNKKGFVFLESVIVLVVVALALTGFMTTYRLQANNAKRREYYDKTSDKYLLYSISALGTNGNDNINSCSDFNINRDFGSSGSVYTSCFSKFYSTKEQAQKMFDDTGLVYLYYIKDISDVLDNSKKPTEKFDNGSIEYIKTLDSNKTNYLIGVFRRSDRYYYASINL